MGLLKKRTPWEQAFREVWQQEQDFLQKYEIPSESLLDRTLTHAVPEKLMGTLQGAFVKAFGVVFEKGSHGIAKVGNQENRCQIFQVNQYAVDLQENRKNLRAFSRAANRSGMGNTLICGGTGISMGLLGIALPDVPLLSAMLLKCVYETAESFGFDHQSELERVFVLRVIETALSDGTVLREQNRILEHFSQTETWLEAVDLPKQLERTAKRVAETLICGKFLQGIPVVGVLGGAEDVLCLRRVQRYATIQYQKRFLIQRRLKTLENKGKRE